MAKATLQEHQKALMTLLQEFDRVCRELEIPYVLFAGSMLGAVRHQGFIPWDDDLDVLMLRADYERFLRAADGLLNREKFHLQKEFTDHWPMFFSKLRLNGTTCLEKYHARDPRIHHGVYMDIFPCDNGADSSFGRKLQYLASKVVIAKAVDKRGYDTDSKLKKLVMAAGRCLPMKPFVKLAQKGGEDSEYVHTFLGGGREYGKNVFPRAWFRERVEMPFADGKYPVPKEYDKLLTMLYGAYMVLPPEEERVVKQHALLVDLDTSYEEYAGYLDGMEFEVHTRSIR